MSSLKESCVSTEDTFRIIEPEESSSNVAALVSRLQIGDSNKCGGKSNKDDGDDDKLNSTFSWLPKITDLCRATVGTQSIKSLESMLTIFLHNVTPSVKECYLKPIRAGKLRVIMTETLVYFHLLYQDIKETIDNTLYLEKMTDLMAMYIDMEIKASRRRKEPIKRVVSRLASALNVFLDQNDAHILDAVMRARFITATDKDICCPVLEKLLSKKRIYKLHDTLYVRYLLVFKLWKKIVMDANKRKEINKMAVALLPEPPPNFSDHYKRFNNVLPRMPNNKNITQFYLQAKINVKSACQNFMKISKDPLHPVTINKPLSFNNPLPYTFSAKATSFDGGVSRNLMNEIWSTFSEDNSMKKKKDKIKKKKVGTLKPTKKKEKKSSSDKFIEGGSPGDVSDGKALGFNRLPELYQRLVQAESSPSTVPTNPSQQYPMSKDSFNLRKTQEFPTAKATAKDADGRLTRFPCSLVPAYDELKTSVEEMSDSVDSPPTPTPVKKGVEAQNQSLFAHLAQVKVEKTQDDVVIVNEAPPSSNYGKIRPARFAKSNNFDIDKYASFINASLAKPVQYKVDPVRSPEPARPEPEAARLEPEPARLEPEPSLDLCDSIGMQVFKESDIQLGDQDLPYIEEEVVEPCNPSEFEEEEDDEASSDCEHLPGSGLDSLKSLSAEISNCISYVEQVSTPPPRPASKPLMPSPVPSPKPVPAPSPRPPSVSTPSPVLLEVKTEKSPPAYVPRTVSMTSPQRQETTSLKPVAVSSPQRMSMNSSPKLTMLSPSHQATTQSRLYQPLANSQSSPKCNLMSPPAKSAPIWSPYAMEQSTHPVDQPVTRSTTPQAKTQATTPTLPSTPPHRDRSPTKTYPSQRSKAQARTPPRVPDPVPTPRPSTVSPQRSQFSRAQISVPPQVVIPPQPVVSAHQYQGVNLHQSSPSQSIPRQQSMTRPHSISPPQTPPHTPALMGPPPPPRAAPTLETHVPTVSSFHDITAIPVAGFVSGDEFKLPPESKSPMGSLSFGLDDDDIYSFSFGDYNEENDLLYLNGGMQALAPTCLLDPSVIGWRPGEGDSILGMPFMVDDDLPAYDTHRPSMNVPQDYLANQQPRSLSGSNSNSSCNIQKLSDSQNCDKVSVSNSYLNPSAPDFISSFDESFNEHRKQQNYVNNQVPKSPPLKPLGKPASHHRSNVASPCKRSQANSRTVVECSVQVSPLPDERSVCINKPSTRGGVRKNSRSARASVKKPGLSPELPSHAADLSNSFGSTRSKSDVFLGNGGSHFDYIDLDDLDIIDEDHTDPDYPPEKKMKMNGNKRPVTRSISKETMITLSSSMPNTSRKTRKLR